MALKQHTPQNLFKLSLSRGNDCKLLSVLASLSIKMDPFEMIKD